MSKMSSKELGRLRGRWLDQIHDDPKMSPAAQSVCYGIARKLMADMGGKARISNDELEKLTHRDLRTVKRSIKEAVKRGHLNLTASVGAIVSSCQPSRKTRGGNTPRKRKLSRGRNTPRSRQIQGQEYTSTRGILAPREAQNPPQKPLPQKDFRSPLLYTPLFSIPRSSLYPVLLYTPLYTLH
jgi:hypothetical protein